MIAIWSSDKIISDTFPLAPWFETRGVAALLTMRTSSPRNGFAVAGGAALLRGVSKDAPQHDASDAPP
jgi:hypothetical protein